TNAVTLQAVGRDAQSPTADQPITFGAKLVAAAPVTFDVAPGGNQGGSDEPPAGVQPVGAGSGWDLQWWDELHGAAVGWGPKWGGAARGPAGAGRGQQADERSGDR